MRNDITTVPAYKIALRHLPESSTAKTPRGIIRAALAARRGQPRPHALPLDGLKVRMSRLWDGRRTAYIEGRFGPIHKTVGVRVRNLDNLDNPTGGYRIRLEWRYLMEEVLKHYSPFRFGWTPRSERWGQDERENRRAKADPKFRAKLLRTLTRKAKKIASIKGIQGNPERIVEWYDQRYRTLIISDFAEIARRYKIVAGRKIPVSFPDQIPGCALVSIDEEMARKIKAPLGRIGKDAQILGTLRTSYLGYSEPGTATRDKYVTSFGTIDPQSGVARFRFHRTHFEISAPDGFYWDIDAHGLRMVDSHGNDYHPDAEDIINDLDIPETIAENAAARELERTRLAAEKAEVEGVWVSLADSIKAGNCRAGTESWGRQNGLYAQAHYHATDLIPLAVNGYGQRVRIAISVAARRHRKEMEQGYCLLADHRA